MHIRGVGLGSFYFATPTTACLLCGIGSLVDRVFEQVLGMGFTDILLRDVARLGGTGSQDCFFWPGPNQAPG